MEAPALGHRFVIKEHFKVQFAKSHLLFPEYVSMPTETGLQLTIPLANQVRRGYYIRTGGKSNDDLFECTFRIDSSLNTFVKLISTSLMRVDFVR